MMMGFWTFFMTARSNITSFTYPMFGFAHVLILSPFCVPAKTTDLAVMFRTSASFGVSPRLPMLHA